MTCELHSVCNIYFISPGSTLGCCRTNRGRTWEKKQLRPYPDGAGTWKGTVYVVQCFFGFAKLEEPAEASSADDSFGWYLPDDAIVAVREWLDTVKFMKTAQARSSYYFMTQTVVQFFSLRLSTGC